jgi:hypothetical protein
MTGLSRPRAEAAPDPSRSRPDSRMLHDSRLLRWRAAAIGMLAIAVVLSDGCLVPQSVDSIANRPHTVPRVDVNNLPDFLLAPMILLDPQEGADAAANPPCHCEIEIGTNTLKVIDDDPTAPVTVRVFVDYDPSNPNSQPYVDSQELPAVFDTTDTTRPLQNPIRLNSTILRGPGIHVVELVLAETAAFAGPTQPPPYRAMNPDFQSTTFKFVVDVLTPPIGTRQSCSDSPPPPSAAQVKVCQ